MPAMGALTAAVLPFTTLAGVVVAATQPLGRDTLMLLVGLLAFAGVALLALGMVLARRR
jgi:hypothetical protein